MPQAAAAAAKKPANKRAGARKKAITISDTESDAADIAIEDDDDEDFGVQEVQAPAATKKGGKKAAAAPKPPAAAKKRGPAKKQQQPEIGQKLLTSMLQPARASPEKKVRKMRASPFNKKSGSVLGRASTQVESTVSEELSSGSPSTSDDIEVVEAPPPKARPQRARAQTRYVVSDSESEPATEDSDFNEDDD